eukprot:m.130478 g.130478  ORF g.130478 m.130478 type:complete len:103 (-) comp23693_c0_seq1:51-359(-)
MKTFAFLTSEAVRFKVVRSAAFCLCTLPGHSYQTALSRWNTAPAQHMAVAIPEDLTCPELYETAVGRKLQDKLSKELKAEQCKATAMATAVNDFIARKPVDE